MLQCGASGACVTVDAGSSIVFGAESSDATCSDGMDNDLDGFVDCVDWNCCRAGVPAPGVIGCATGTCAPTRIPSCGGDADCPPDTVCVALQGKTRCVKGCHDASRCLATWRCEPGDCAACPCPGRCAPPSGVVVPIDEGVHHLGDGPGAEGTVYQRSFEVQASWRTATVEFDFPGGPGPNLERSPQVRVNGAPAPSVLPFFPPLEPGMPWWQTNPDGSHGCNRRMHVSLDVSSLVVPGTNVFQLSDGRPDDDFQFGNVLVWLR